MLQETWTLLLLHYLLQSNGTIVRIDMRNRKQNPSMEKILRASCPTPLLKAGLLEQIA